MSVATARRRSIGNAPALSWSFSDWPSSHSMAMNGVPRVLGDFVDGADVRMIERRGGPRFAAEPFDRGRVGVDRRGQELQRHLASERQILGEVDNAHPAAAKQRLDSVVSNGVTGVQCDWQVMLPAPARRGGRTRQDGCRAEGATIESLRLYPSG